MIDVFNNKLPYNFRDICILNSQLHSYATRRSNNIHTQFTEQTTAIIQYSVKGRISIPDDLRNTSFPSTTTPPNF